MLRKVSILAGLEGSRCRFIPLPCEMTALETSRAQPTHCRLVANISAGETDTEKTGKGMG
jgi:hypothetical protein